MERTKHLTIQILLVIVISIVYFIEFIRDQGQIIESLKRWSPLFLGISFLIFVFLFVLSAKKIFEPFRSFTRRQWIVLGLVGALAFGLAFFVAPRTHRIYYDESIYLHIGQSIAYTGQAQMINFGEIKHGELIVNQSEYNKQPNSYPFLLSVFYRFFGCSENLSFFLTNIIFVLSALTIFGIAYLLFGAFKTGVYAALAYTVIPQNILWHNTTAAEPANTLFLILTVFLMLSALRNEGLRLYILAAASACIAAQFRIESLLIFPLLIVILFLKNHKILKEQRLYYIIPLVLILLLAHILHLYCFLGHPWGVNGNQEKLSLSFLGNNLKTNGGLFVNGKDFPALLTIFALLALFSKKFIRERLKILIWFLSFWGVFLFFYAGSYYYGADIRFSLMAFPPFAILSAYGLTLFENFLKDRYKLTGPFAIAVIIIAFLSFAPRTRTVGEEAWAARMDHFYAQKMAEQLPANSIIFTHNPNMFLFWGKSAAQASILSGYDQNGLQGLKSNFPGGVFFHFNFWCNVSDPLQQSFCKGILDKFGHIEVLKYQERDYNYVLYKIE